MQAARVAVVWVLVAAAAAMLAEKMAAIERRPLPAFSVLGLGGETVGSSQLPIDGTWLVVYVQPRCTSCDALLRSIDPKTHPRLPARIAVIAGRADAPGATRYAAGFANLSGARWYADPEGALARTLKLPGAPVVIGLRDGGVEWSIAGLVPDVDTVRAAIISWAGR